MKLSLAAGLLLALVLPIRAQAVTFVHNPVLQATAGQALPIQAALVGAPSGTDLRVRLFWRAKGKEQYKSVEMGGSAAALDASIPGADITMAGLQYYIKATDNKGFNVTGLVHDVVVRKDIVAPELTLLSPQEGLTLDTARPVITAAYGDSDSGIDMRSAGIFLDGKDVTKDGELQVYDTLMSYIPNFDITDGEHKIELSVADGSGNVSKLAFKAKFKASAQGGFEVKAKDWRLDGRLQLETQYTNTNQSRVNAPLPFRPYGANRGKLELNARGPADTFSLSVSKTDEERNDQQPLDRYLLSWKSDEATYAVGDFAPSFSELSLYQLYQLRGVTLDMNSGRLDEGHTRMVGVWGQTRRAIEAGSSGLVGSGTTPTYAQDLLGGRWEFGGPWFQWGFNSVTVNDAVESVSKPGSQLPRYNWLSTSDMKIGVPPWGLTLSGEAGIDLYSDNSPLLGSSLGSAYRAGAKLAPKGTGTQVSFEFKDMGGNFGFLPGGYTSVANPGLLPDYRGYESSISQDILDGQYSVGLDWNRWRDNLQGLPDRGVTQNEHMSGYLSLAPSLGAHSPGANVRYTTDTMVNDADGNTGTTVPHFKVDSIFATLEAGLSYGYLFEAQKALSLFANYSRMSQQDRLARHFTQDNTMDTFIFGSNVTYGWSGFNASYAFGTSGQPGMDAADTQMGVNFAPRFGRNQTGNFRWSQSWIPAVFDSNLGYSLGLQCSTVEAFKALPRRESFSRRDTFSAGLGYNPAKQQRLTLDVAVALVAGRDDMALLSAAIDDQVSQTQGRLRYDLSF